MSLTQKLDRELRCIMEPITKPEKGQHDVRTLRALIKAGRIRLDAPYLSHSVVHTLQTHHKIQSFTPPLAKPVLDRIDRVLAKHDGFTDEELDFIINDDIKYRMGR